MQSMLICVEGDDGDTKVIMPIMGYRALFADPWDFGDFQFASV